MYKPSVVGVGIGNVALGVVDGMGTVVGVTIGVVAAGVGIIGDVGVGADNEAVGWIQAYAGIPPESSPQSNNLE